MENNNENTTKSNIDKGAGMNILEEINRCDVRWVALGEVATFYGGLTGKTKYDFERGNSEYITYKSVFNNIEVDFNNTQLVTINTNEKQHCIQYGDILFTGSSETAQEVGMSSVVTTKLQKNIYLNSFCFGLRFNDDIQIMPQFAKYLFRSDLIRNQIIKTAHGVTRFNLSKKQFAKIQIPLPPLPLQQKIAEILDLFSTHLAELSTELSTELIARRKQYQYYRDKLLDFGDKEGVEWKVLGEVCEKIYSGGTPKTDVDEYWNNGDIPWASSGEVNLGTIFETQKFITQSGLNNSSAKYVPKNSVLMALAGQGKTRGMVARTRIDLTTNQSLAALVFDDKKVSSDYVFYYLKTQYQNLRQISSGNSGRGGLNLQMIKSFQIPLPPLAEQRRIVEILDKFDTLTNSLSEGLPKEIDLRQKQYAYYRDKLLSFDRPV